MRLFKLLFASLPLAMAVAAATPASAAPVDPGQHRQHQVVQRAHHQIHRINRMERRGEISPQRAHALRAREHRVIRHARASHGHMGPHEQRHLNHRLNADSRAISG